MRLTEFLSKYGVNQLIDETEIVYNEKFRIRDINQTNKEKLR
jgi:hypothetical protein